MDFLLINLLYVYLVSFLISPFSSYSLQRKKRIGFMVYVQILKIRRKGLVITGEKKDYKILFKKIRIKYSGITILIWLNN